MASDRFVEQTRLARATAATARQVRDEALAARARCLDIIGQDRSLRLRLGEGRRCPGHAEPGRPEGSAGMGRPVRMVGVADSACAVGSRGHLCWAYQDRAEFLARALECISDGIAAGQRVEYVGSGDAEALRAELAGLAGIDDVLAGDGVGVSPVGDFYRFRGHSEVINPGVAVAACTAAAQDALAAGYSGLRVVVDATALVRTPQQREAFACFEHLIDRQMIVAPISGLCGYDSSELGGAAVAELACLHPLASAGCAAFQLCAEQGVDFALAGHIDRSCAELFATTMRRVVPLSSGPELVVDGRAVEFIDHQRLLVLIEATQRAGATVALRDAPATAVLIAEILKLGGLRVQRRR